MPYIIRKVTGGYKVAKDKPNPKTGRYIYFSNKPLTREMATRQLRALYVAGGKK